MRIKIIVSIVCVVLVVCLGFGGKYLFDTMSYRKIVSEAVIATPDLTRVQDGAYTGAFEAILVSAIVEVTVEDSIITKIVIREHVTDRGKPAESIIEDVIINQTLDVDTVTGATNSSTVILKAIENALMGGIAAH